MGKARVRGQHNEISVQTMDGTYLKVGEITKMSVEELGEIKKNRGIGEAEITANKTFEGYDFTFEGGLVDWNLSSLLHRQDKAIVDGDRAPYFRIVQKIKFYGTNKIVTDTYNNVVIAGYNLETDSMDESMQKWKGYSGSVKERKDDLVTIDAVQNDTGVEAMIAKALQLDEDNSPFY